MGKLAVRFRPSPPVLNFTLANFNSGSDSGPDSCFRSQFSNYSGWSPVGYGNHVIIDHGNGYRTLYGHMQVLYVAAGQTVNRGDRIGKMGSTGRSTGVHTHFEVILNGVYINPLNVLR